MTDYISPFTAEIGRQPTYDEYAQITTGYTPEQVPVLSTIAKGFGVFDHWFCEVPSQTFMNRSFWTAATSSGLTVNHPVGNWIQSNTAETLFDRLEAHGRTWKVYIQEPNVKPSCWCSRSPGSSTCLAAADRRWRVQRVGIAIPPELTGPNPTPAQVVAGVRKIAGEFFPRLATKPHSVPQRPALPVERLATTRGITCPEI